MKKSGTFIDKLAAQLKEMVEIDEQKAKSENEPVKFKHDFLANLRY